MDGFSLRVQSKLHVGFVPPGAGDGQEIVEQLLLTLLLVQKQQAVLEQPIEALSTAHGQSGYLLNPLWFMNSQMRPIQV